MNTRELIIDILSREWPLSAKKIHSIIKRNNIKHITYHTMYEILQDLVEKGIVQKNKVTYSLDKKWINIQLQRFQKINDSYEDNKPMRIIDKKTTEIKVNSIEELHKFILKNNDTNFFSENTKTFFMKCQHIWGGFYNKEDKEILRKTFKNGSYIIAKHNDFLDKEILKFYKSIGAKVKLGCDINSSDTIIIGDCVIQIYFPNELINKIEKVHTGKLTLSKMRESKKIYEETHDIDILVIRNDRISETLKKEIKSYF